MTITNFESLHCGLESMNRRIYNRLGTVSSFLHVIMTDFQELVISLLLIELNAASMNFNTNFILGY